MPKIKKVAVVELQAFEVSNKKRGPCFVNGRNFYSLSYRHSGKVTIKTDTAELISCADHITFMPMGTSYINETVEDTKMSVAHFRLSENLDFGNPAVIKAEGSEIRSLFEKLTQSSDADDSVDFKRMAIFYEILADLETLLYRDSKAHVSARIEDARNYIIQNYSDPYLSISSVAEHAGISASYLRREFSHSYGECPAAFLKRLRINNAKNMLGSEYLSISEIAEKNGFSSASYFIQVFHHTVGISPNQYRRKYLLHSTDSDPS